jgi:uncharacterized protein (TIGR02453 family)
MAAAGFTGFPRDTFSFLRGLADNNNKAWFDAHRADYQNYCLAPGFAFIDALGPRLKKIAPMVKWEARVNGSIFRINRDIRFSKDKRPYKTNLDMWFWHGERGGWAAPGFFVRIGPDTDGVGAGMHSFLKPQLDAFRKAVVDPRSGKALQKAIDAVRSAGYEIHGATRKTVPRGFDSSHPRADLLLHEGLWAEVSEKPGKLVGTPAFVEACADHARAMWPLGKWLLAEVAATT